MQALETAGKDDDKQWLTYWAIYAMFMFLDDYAGFILSYFPFYYFAKVCFLIWLFNPATNGALSLYNFTIRPLFKKYELPLTDLFKFVFDISQELIHGEKKRIDLSPKKQSQRNQMEEEVKTTNTEKLD